MHPSILQENSYSTHCLIIMNPEISILKSKKSLLKQTILKERDAHQTQLQELQETVKKKTEELAALLGYSKQMKRKCEVLQEEISGQHLNSWWGI